MRCRGKHVAVSAGARGATHHASCVHQPRAAGQRARHPPPSALTLTSSSATRRPAVSEFRAAHAGHGCKSFSGGGTASEGAGMLHNVARERSAPSRALNAAPTMPAPTTATSYTSSPAAAPVLKRRRPSREAAGVPSRSMAACEWAQVGRRNRPACDSARAAALCTPLLRSPDSTRMSALCYHTHSSPNW